MTVTIDADAGAHPAPDTAGLEGMRPGPELAAVLAGRDPRQVGDEELVDLIQAYRRMASWAQAGELAVVAELARRRDAEDQQEPAQAWASRCGPVDAVVDEVALALTLTVGSAYGWVELARDLSGRFAATRRALSEGCIDLAKARVISDALLGLDDERAARIEERALVRALAQTTGQLRAWLRREVLRADPKTAEQRRRQAEKRRRVDLWESPEGTSALGGYDLPPDAASAAYQKISALAHALAADGDARRIDELRADVYLDLLRGRPLPEVAQPPGPCSPASSVCVDSAPAADSVAAAFTSDGAERASEAAVAKELSGQAARTVAEAIAEGIAEELTGVRAGAAAAGLAGLVGDRRGGTALLIEAATRRMAEAVAGFKRRWCAATSGPLDANGTCRGVHGHEGYRPPEWMRQLVQHRDGRCVFPSCRRPAKQCDLDHSLAFHKGGTTCLCNLALLCRRHHQVKQHRAWRLLQPWPGVVVWITPAGKWYLSLPDLDDHPDRTDHPDRSDHPDRTDHPDIHDPPE